MLGLPWNRLPFGDIVGVATCSLLAYELRTVVKYTVGLHARGMSLNVLQETNSFVFKTESGTALHSVGLVWRLAVNHVRSVEVCGNDFLVIIPIESFPFPFPAATIYRLH